ncbi:MAG: GIY-YIG nuclease family protein [Clostridiales bacterium]|nr:GIY-YIG nuclease family protein [Clostridiales bacterium]
MKSIVSYTYILRCADETLYTGWTNDLPRRLKAHNNGLGSKYTKSRLPVELVYYEEFTDKREAQRREYVIKQLSRKKKERLIYALTSPRGNNSNHSV